MLRGRCNSEPAVTVRDPTAASGRLTGWNSQTDGESPDGRQHATAGPVRSRCGAAVPASLISPAGPPARPPELDQRSRARGQDRWQSNSTSDAAMMRRALALAAHGPQADANPRVGCVLVDPAGAVVAAGWHHGAGTAHAEADALEAAGERAAGCTAYVTLEPCNHTGRTPSCAKALYAAGVARVVYAQADPNPVGGRRGVPGCAAQGVVVEAGLLADEAEPLNRTWTHLDHHRPTVGHLEARDHPRRPQRRRRRHQPVDHRERRPGRTSTSSGRAAAPSSSAPAPRCSTTPS